MESNQLFHSRFLSEFLIPRLSPITSVFPSGFLKESFRESQVLYGNIYLMLICISRIKQ